MYEQNSNNNCFDIQLNYTLEEKLSILSDAAKYDVACTSSGADRRGQRACLAIPVRLVSAMLLLRMADAYHCLRY